MADTPDIVKLIRDVGIYGLGWNSGCPCTEFEVKGVQVNVSCHKGAREITVTEKQDFNGYTRGDLELIAKEVKRQMDDHDDEEWKQSHPYAIAIQPFPSTP